MRLSSLTYLLLAVAGSVSAVAFPRTYPSNEDPSNHISVLATSDSSSTNHLPTEQQHRRLDTRRPRDMQNRDSAFHGKDEHERLVALCEAGFVSGCQAAIEEEKSGAGSITPNPNSQSNTIISSPLAPVSSFFDSKEATNNYFGNLLPSFNFFVVAITVVCVVTILRAVVRSRTFQDRWPSNWPGLVA
ncbi:hypothetical protein N7466_001022 [Penicillium verhagenii]|uniref:uncharacterized protein n=1 Tax=Penicillium verhagenii TaxID=1562060 RepID=UPI00254510ED|nr:uncharacterized protein N7466_001022 [Penicillium verhagenii]KAJ5948007.1 hypothetical protein N7466_001022 [Penicillium verhagenii]